MENSVDSLTQNYITARHTHPAWQLLASRRAPLVISCLKCLFEKSHDGMGILVEESVQFMSEIFSRHANNTEFDIDTEDYSAQAHRELRSWIKKRLVVERKGRLFATDALQTAIQFIEGLDNRMMTSTASRLSTVQREIEMLESRLNCNAESRANHLRKKIRALEEELKQVASGVFEVLEGADAVEGIREVYHLAMSLRGDFRRVEDSYREADQNLRQAIVREQRHRGEIVDSLLDSHDNLLETMEGKVFHSFYEQLNQSTVLENMKAQLRTILDNAACEEALGDRQKTELRRLVTHLVSESLGVIRARARSERDVKGFLKTGLASENHRVGELVLELMEAAFDMEWKRASLRRAPAPLPPLAVAVSNLPVPERLQVKFPDSEALQVLDLDVASIDLDDVDDAFWEAFDGLDRIQLIEQTRNLLEKAGREMGLAELATHLMTSHDLETLTLWLGLAREAEVPFSHEMECVDVDVSQDERIRFNVPKITLTAEVLNGIDWEKLG